MKKLFSLIIAVVMLFALCAGCKNTKDDVNKPSEDDEKPGISNDIQAGTQISGETLGTIDKEQQVYPSDDAEINIATKMNFTSMTQFGTAFGASLQAAGLFYETLLDFDITTNDVKPALAENWEWVDGLTLRFKLCEGINSINGDPFTAHDVVYTLNANNEVSTLSSYYNIFDYEKTKAVDDLTVDIVLKEPYPYLALDMSHSAYQMVCEKSVEAAGVEALKENPIAGTGPYKLVKWDTGVSVRAERREDYWGQIPYYKYINLVTVTDANTRYMGLESGDYDMCADIPMSSVLSAEDNNNLKAWTFVHCGKVTNLAMNTDANEFLQNKLCRQAISLGINYEAIVNVAASGLGVVPLGGCFNQYSPYYAYKDEEPEEDNYCFGKYDPELAKQKLVEAGYEAGYTLTLKLSSGDSVMQACAEMIKNNLAQININVNIELVEAATMTADARAGNWELRIVSGGNPNGTRGLQTIDPRVDHAAASGSAGQYWFEGHSVDEVAAMIDACKFTPEGEELDEAIREFEDFMGEYVPKINLVLTYATFVTSDDIAGFDVISMGTPDLTSIYPQEYIDGPAK